MKKLFINLKEKAKVTSRRKKDKQFYSYCSKECKVVDIGVHPENSSDINNVKTNHFLNGFKYSPKYYTGLGIESMDNVKKKYPKHNFVEYSGGTFPFSEKQFTWAYSNAVIEHVGDLKKKEIFLREMIRVAENVFFTTPNKYFPVDAHTGSFFIHWNNKLFSKWRNKNRKWLPLDRLNLLSIREIKQLLRMANAKNAKIIRNRFWGLTMTFSVIIKNQ